MSTETHWTAKLGKFFTEEALADAQEFESFNEWWAGIMRSDDMLYFLQQAGYRDSQKLRHIAIRFIRETRANDNRAVWDLFTDQRAKDIVEVVERFNNGEATTKEFDAARAIAWELMNDTTNKKAVDIVWSKAQSTAFASQTSTWDALCTEELAKEWDNAWDRVSEAVYELTADDAWQAVYEVATITAEVSNQMDHALAQQAQMILEIIPATVLQEYL